MNDDIKKAIKNEIELLGNKIFEDDLPRRNKASADFNELIKRMNLLNGGVLSKKDLCDTICAVNA